MMPSAVDPLIVLPGGTLGDVKNTECDEDLVDADEVARRLGVQLETVYAWRKRTKAGLAVALPPERHLFSGVPVWEWRDILIWAGRTGRLTDEDLRADYVHLMGQSPREPRTAGSLSSEEQALVAAPTKRRRRRKPKPDAPLAPADVVLPEEAE